MSPKPIIKYLAHTMTRAFARTVSFLVLKQVEGLYHQAAVQSKLVLSDATRQWNTSEQRIVSALRKRIRHRLPLLPIGNVKGLYSHAAEQSNFPVPE
jgi:hypothetical protein